MGSANYRMRHLLTGMAESNRHALPDGQLSGGWPDHGVSCDWMVEVRHPVDLPQGYHTAARAQAWIDLLRLLRRAPRATLPRTRLAALLPAGGVRFHVRIEPSRDPRYSKTSATPLPLCPPPDPRTTRRTRPRCPSSDRQPSGGTIAYVRAIISRPDRGTWPQSVLREAEYNALLHEVTAGSTSWMITGRGAKRRPWRWSPTQGFLWESTDPPDPEIISQLASLQSATLVVRFPDTSALQVDLRTRRWTVLAPHTGSTAHDRTRRIHERLRRFDQWWRNFGLAFAVALILGTTALVAPLILGQRTDLIAGRSDLAFLRAASDDCPRRLSDQRSFSAETCADIHGWSHQRHGRSWCCPASCSHGPHYKLAR